jgi:hypothetical protein
VVEIKTHRDHPASMQERINKRYRNSGGEEADFTTKVGEGPNRLFHNQHNPGTARQHGAPNKGEPGVDGKMRGPAAPLIGQLGEGKR